MVFRLESRKDIKPKPERQGKIDSIAKVLISGKGTPLPRHLGSLTLTWSIWVPTYHWEWRYPSRIWNVTSLNHIAIKDQESDKP
jgi:hypothetical protein